MSFLRRRREDRREEATSPFDEMVRREVTTALPVDPDRVKSNIIQEMFTRPFFEVPKERLYTEELDRVLTEAANEIYESIVAQTSQLSQQVLNVINSKTLKSSMLLVFSNIYASVGVKLFALQAAIERIAKMLQDPSLPDEKKAELHAELIKKAMMAISVPLAVIRLLKDLDSRIVMNVPFSMKSDLVRNLMGYTAT